MDFNPLDILAAAALGEKDAPSEVKSSKAGQASSGHQESSEAADSKDADDDSNEGMGKTTSNGLKHKKSAIDIGKGMAPQKIAWSPETLLPTHIDGMTVTKETFSLDELVQDIKKKGLEVEFQKIIDKSIIEDVCQKDTINTDQKHCQNNNLVSVKNAINNPSENELNKPQEDDSDPPLSSEMDTTMKYQETQALATDQKDTIKEQQNESGSVLREQQEQQNESGSGDVLNLNNHDSAEEGDFSTEMSSSESVSLDHSYALLPGQIRPPIAMEEDDDIDVCSGSSPLSEETEQRSRNLSLDCNYLKSGIMEGVSASTLDLYKMSSSSLGRSKLPSSSSSSTSSPTSDLVSKATHDENGEPLSGISTLIPTASDSASPTSVLRPAPKYGKFRIGTFASFSSSNLELEKYLKHKDTANNKKLNIGIPPDTHLINSSLSSPSVYSGVHPLLQSPSLDWDRSEAGSETQDDSSDARTPYRLSPDFTVEKMTEWSHPMYHDHDYCAKETETSTLSGDQGKMNLGKRKYTKRKSKLDGVNHEKIMKAKYLKKELLKQDSFMKVSSETESVSTDPCVIKANPVGRPRKRPLDKVIDEEIDPETGTKLKITGKFQDQYVYYLSKSSRTTTRRRQAPALHHPSDKIIVPAPKPGDIVVPHLTDADIETVRLKGRSALNLPDRPHMRNVTCQPPPIPLSLPSSQPSEFISDVDSHIVSTILSMENDNLASSPTTSHASDISSSGLNPNQPALTESLRLMSGDSSITSEHVLNYLLSVVKDDGLLDTSSSALFPSIMPDAIYTKADTLSEPSVVVQQGLPSSVGNSTTSNTPGQDMGDIVKSVQSCSFNSTNLPSSAQNHEPDNFVHNVSRDQIEENVSLPDDFSSFISNSQGTSSSNTTQDGDSHSSFKSMFGSDLSSLGTPQLSSSVPRLTSIEKTLDYLGVKDGDIKLDGHDFGSKLEHVDSSQPLTSLPISSADDTPWIVTVTLYFNDVPAIMINSQPYIRLVDIHKQILPAKDTGILKKRCQLLKIPVLNCTEMQRYFLVQYGKAYNSKSTLIVSKEQATNLVTYYAMPQPRIGRMEDVSQRRPSSGGSDGVSRSPVTQAPRKRGSGKNSRKAAATLGVTESELLEESVSHHINTPESEASTSSHSKRTRHKKINYLELLKGEEKEKSTDAAILETIESVVKSAPDYAPDGKSIKAVSKKKKDDSICDKKNKVEKKKSLAQFKMKKPCDKAPKAGRDQSGPILHKIKGAKGKSGKGDTPVERDADVSSEIDSEDSMDVSQSKKFKPLKLKVNSLLNFAGQRKGSSPTKKGLFSRSNSTTSPTTDPPLRVLAVAHQSALSANNAESHLPSQPADIHLDLFTKSSSACVRCETCSQFLSVPHFMRHHHVAMDNEWLATEAAHRILVPRNKENISKQEKQLWEEFHRLQEAIGGFGEADDETDSGGEEDYTDDDDDDDDQSSFELSGASSSLLSIDRSPLPENGIVRGVVSSGLLAPEEELSAAEEDRNENPIHLNIKSPTELQANVSDSEKVSNDTLSKIGLVKRDTSESVQGSSLPNGVLDRNASSNVRTSSRKRKSKQLFSIENYYTPKKSFNDEDGNVQEESLNAATVHSGSNNAISFPSKSRNSSVD